jgi:hypothetical protein
VSVGIAEVAELLLELYLVTVAYIVSARSLLVRVELFIRVRVSVQSKQVNINC